MTDTELLDFLIERVPCLINVGIRDGNAVDTQWLRDVGRDGIRKAVAFEQANNPGGRRSLARVKRLRDGDTAWAVEYRGEIVVCEESWTVADAIADGLNGKHVSGEIAEVVERIRFMRD